MLLSLSFCRSRIWVHLGWVILSHVLTHLKSKHQSALLSHLKLWEGEDLLPRSLMWPIAGLSSSLLLTWRLSFSLTVGQKPPSIACHMTSLLGNTCNDNWLLSEWEREQERARRRKKEAFCRPVSERALQHQASLQAQWSDGDNPGVWIPSWGGRNHRAPP